MTPKGLPPFETAPVASSVLLFFQSGAEQVCHSNIIKQRRPVTPERSCSFYNSTTGILWSFIL